MDQAKSGSTNVDHTIIDQNNFYKEQKELFYNAIINDDINFITTFLNDSTTSPLYSQFKYTVEKDYIDCFQISPLIVATINNKISIVQYLIQYLQQQQDHPPHHNNDQQQQDTTDLLQFNPLTYHEGGIPLFHFAITSESHEMIEYIFSLYISASTTTEPITINNISSQFSRTSLQFAARFSSFTLLQYLIQHYNADILIRNATNVNVLQSAAASTQDSIAKLEYLLSFENAKDVLLQSRDDSGSSALSSAVDFNNVTTFEYLLPYYDLEHEAQTESLICALSENGDIDMFDRIYKSRPHVLDLFTLEEHGFTPLSLSIKTNQLPMVKHLVEQYHVNTNTTGVYSSPLNRAAANGKASIELIDYLITLNPSSLDRENVEGSSPLVLSSARGHTQALEHLVKHHHVNPFKNPEFNLMHIAVEHDQPISIPSIAKVFGSSIKLRDNDPTFTSTNPAPLLPRGYPRLVGEWNSKVKSPLHNAILQHKLNCVKQLVRLKANITTTNHIPKLITRFSSILHLSFIDSISTNDYSILEYLLSDECLADWNSQTELKFNDDKTIEIYGQYDPIAPQLDMHDTKNSCTPLLWAAMACNLKAMELFIARKANIYAIVSSHNMNILHALFSSAHAKKEYPQDDVLKVVNYIFSLQDVNIKSLLTQKATDGETPLIYAARYSSFPIVHKLLQIATTVPQDESNGFGFDQLFTAAVSNTKFAMIADLLREYPQYYFRTQLHNVKSADALNNDFPPFQAIVVQKCIMALNEANNETIAGNTDIDIDFKNPDIDAFIQYDPTFLVQKTAQNSTVMHMVAEADDKLYTRLAGLIEVVIDHLDLI